MMKRTTIVLGGSLLLGVACVPQEVTPGPPGEPGAPGAPGVGANMFFDCPIGYERDSSAIGMVLCKRGADEVVRVGKGGSAFWIDRYEASVFENEDGSGRQFGVGADDYPSTFPKNGQLTTPVFALSRKDVTPSRYITWFQAQAVCNASGKQLPTRNQWLEAARGTPDPGENSGSQGQCVTKADGPRRTGMGSVCRSRWGVEDMVGNVWEWTDEWYAGVGKLEAAAIWPKVQTDYADDRTYNITSVTILDGQETTGPGIPSAAIRGGTWGMGSAAGVFTLSVADAPTRWNGPIGFRCVVPR